MGIYTPVAHMEHDESRHGSVQQAEDDGAPRHLYLTGLSDGRLETTGVAFEKKRGLRKSMRKLSMSRAMASHGAGASEQHATDSAPVALQHQRSPTCLIQ